MYLHMHAQITEMYSSGGELHLELLTGQNQGSKTLWVSKVALIVGDNCLLAGMLYVCHQST